MPVLDNYLNVVEAAAILGVHWETVKRFCREGRIPAEKVHNMWLIRREHLQEFAATYDDPRRGKRRNTNAANTVIRFKKDREVYMRGSLHDVKPLTFAELFAGCGGISLGLGAAGFELVFANEISGMAAETFCFNLVYKHQPPSEDPENWYVRICKPTYKNGKGGLVLENHEVYKKKSITKRFQEQLENPSHKMFVGDVGKLVKALQIGKSKGLLNEDFQRVDLLAGGPPCQSFSLAGRRERGNKRNALFENFARCAEILEPKVILFENVPGIIHPFKDENNNKKWHAWYEVAKTFYAKNYIPICTIIDASWYGVPQARQRFFVIAIRGDIVEKAEIVLANQVPWQNVLTVLKTCRNHFKYSRQRIDTKLIYGEKNVLLLDPLIPDPTKNAPRTTSDAIGDLLIIDERITSNSPSHYSRYLEDELPFPGSNENPLPLANHERRHHNDKTKLRFKIIQILQENKMLPPMIDQKHITAEHVKVIFANREKLMLIDGMYKDTLASIDDIKELLHEIYSKKHSQKALEKDEPAPAQVSIPDDYVHYDESQTRTLTVREMARIQGFPDWFIFRSKVTTGGKLRSYEVPQYTQVGNAVPPLLAKQVGMGIARFLRDVGG